MEALLYSTASLELDALPALTARYYRGRPALYTQARVYAAPQGLHVGLWVFQRQPQPLAHACFAVAGAAGLVCAQITPSAAGLHELPLSAAPFPGDENGMPPEETRFFAGEDEQGWYWGGSLLVPAAVLARAGAQCQPGNVLCCAVYVWQAGMAGASCALGANSTPLQPALLTPFLVSGS